MYIFNCKVCNRQFSKRRENSQFCSTKCYNLHREQNGIPRHHQSKGSCLDCGAIIKLRSKRCNLCNNKYNASKRTTPRVTENPFCNTCGILKTKENTYSPADGKWAPTCRECRQEIGRRSQEGLKQGCVDYKGGCCQVCGYNKCLAALDFHHLDPTEKDFTVARKKLNIKDDKMRAELDKCVLLCANCHREEHRLLVRGKSFFPLSEDWSGTNSS